MSDKAKYNDQELISAIKTGNVPAFKELYYLYYKKIHSFLYLHTSSNELAKDLTQETFTRIWEKKSNLKPQQSIKAYLYKIAKNLLIDYYRKKKSRQTYIDFQINEENKNFDDSLESNVVIKIAIQNLPEKIRLVFILSRYHGLKYIEIADVLDISVKTVESRMSQAFVILRDELQ